MKAACFLTTILSIAAPVSAAITLGQVETFDNPHGWIVAAGPGQGLPPNPVAVPVETMGGLTGDDDPYLHLVSSGGEGPGSRLTAQNFTDWAGNYIAAGVNAIQMDVRNFGSAADLHLRLLFVEFDAMQAPVSAAFTDKIVIPALSDWQTIRFDVRPSALTPLPLPVASALQTLSNAGELRIFHNPDPFFIPGQNPPIAGNLGVDNVTAQFIPEPATWAAMGGGLLLVGLLRRRSSKT